MLPSPAHFGVIKDCLLNAHENGIKKITDSDHILQKLCEAIERAFRLGFTSTRRVCDYWSWMENIVTLSKIEKIRNLHIYEEAVKLVRKNSSVTTDQGRGRLLIRALLQKGILDFPIKFMMEHQDYALKLYNPAYSALSNEIFVQIFCSLISQVCRLPVSLTMENAEFLDETWEMPFFKKIELVPCLKLGASIESMGGHAVVVSLDPCGVAAEDGEVEVGDVLVTMYGKTLRNNTRRISSLRHTHEGQPVPVTLVKAVYPDGRVFGPLSSLLSRYGAEHLLPPSGLSHAALAPTVSQQSYFQDHPWCRLIFLGHCNVGADGGVHMVNRSISQVLEQRRDEKDYIPVQMEIGELGITVWAHNPTNGDIDKCSDPLLRHSFPQIVSCGRRTDGTNYLAYIVGQEMCNVAKEFNCYVFQAVSRADSKFLINAIAQGFDRTHWTL